MPYDLDLNADLLDRFLRYVGYDTTAVHDASTYPSTAKQLVLLRALADECRAIGMTDVKMDDYGYVTATLEGNLPADRVAKIPTIGLLAHVDTSDAVSGTDIKPQVIRDYAGGDIALPGDSTQVIRVADYPMLAKVVGHDVITTDGTTLLGADDKAGIAEILAAVQYLVRHPEISHGRIRVGFTPDEEVGAGVRHFDIAAFGCAYAYTVDGGEIGEIADETFSADSALVTIRGRSVHPGQAKDKMVNSVKLAAEFIALLPKGRLSPETTEGHEGYVHPDTISGSVEETTIKFILRDYTEEGLKAHESLLRAIAAEVAAAEPRAAVDVEIRHSYRNMKAALDRRPEVVANLEAAVRQAGIEPIFRPVRGGTDGSDLTARGLPTPNLFTGGFGAHGKLEWISLQHMGKATEVLINLAQIVAE